MNKRKFHNIILLIMLFLTFSISAFSSNQQEIESAKISINKDNLTLKEVFTILKIKTNYTFTYGEYVLKNKGKYDLKYTDTPLTKGSISYSKRNFNRYINRF